MGAEVDFWDRRLGAEAAAISRDADKFKEEWGENGWVVMTGVGESVFNIAMMTGPDQDELYYYYQVLGGEKVPFEIWIPERNLESVLPRIGELGLEEKYQLDHMVLVPEKMAKIEQGQGFDIRSVDCVERLREVVGIHLATFGFDESIAGTMGQLLLADPNIKTLLVYENEKPVATAMAIIDPETKTAGIWNVATLPGKQRRGLGTVVMKQLIVDLREAGVETVHLASTSEGHKLYKNLGFELMEQIVCFG